MTMRPSPWGSLSLWQDYFRRWPGTRSYRAVLSGVCSDKACHVASKRSMIKERFLSGWVKKAHKVNGHRLLGKWDPIMDPNKLFGVVVVCKTEREELCSMRWVCDSLQPINNNQDLMCLAFHYARNSLVPPCQMYIHAIEKKLWKKFHCCLFSASEALLACDAWKRCGHALLITLT